MFKAEHDFEISYHTLQQLISTEKYFPTASETPGDDCRCEKCVNSELLLITFKTSLSKTNNHNLTSMASGDAADFVSSIACSVKEYDCCNDSCQNCPGKAMLEEIIQFLNSSDNITYSKWIQKNSLYQKTEIGNLRSLLLILLMK